MRRFSREPFGRNDRLNPQLLNPVVEALDAAIDELEKFRDFNWQEQVDAFNTNALKRFSDAIAPVVDQIRTAADGGFLVAQTADLVAIVEGSEINFYIPPEARVAYRPTPFLAIVAPDVREDWAIGRLLVYNDVTGLLTVEILHLNGSGAERSGWTVAASSGVVEAVYQWMTETKAARDATIDAASQALTDIATAGALIISDAETARDEAVEAAETSQAAAILIAGGPVSSVNGHTGPVSGMLEQAGAQDITGLKTLKIGDADDVIDWLRLQPTDYATGKPMLRLGKKLASSTAWTLGLYDGTNNAGTLDIDVTNFTWNGSKLATEAVAIETEKTFVASGAISTGQIVALRSDGKVEVVSGTETFASLGADATFTAAPNTPRFLNAAYNAVSGKVAVVYRDLSSGGTIWVVIGTVTGTSISWGTPETFTGGSGGSYFDKAMICWNAAGTTVIVVFNGTTNYVNFVAATVSGTDLTFGAVAPAGTTVFGSPTYSFFKHDDIHGSRVIFWNLVSGGPVLLAATYTGTTLTVGANSAFNSTAGASVLFSAFYDAPNARFIFAATTTAVSVVRHATVSGTTWTQGTEASTSGIKYSIAELDPVTGKLLIFGPDGSNLPTAAIVTFSGTTATINTVARVSNTKIVSIPTAVTAQAVYEPSTGKFVVVAPHNTDSAPSPGMVLWIGTVSGTTITWTQPLGLKANGASLKALFAKGSSSEVFMVYSDYDDFDRWHVKIGSIASGEFVQTEDILMRSAMVTKPEALSTSLESSVFEGGKILKTYTGIIDINHYGAPGSTSVTTMTAFVLDLPSESTNADKWIGQAKETVVNGANVKVKLRGSIASGLAGLTPGVDYYLKGDGSAITANNGRRLGKALSATEILMEAA